MSKEVCIALVDDEVDTEIIYKGMLKSLIDKNHTKIFYFEGAIKFLDFLKEKSSNIDIIILVTDINMPVMDGLNLAKIISVDYPSIDIYVSSAYANPEYDKACDEIGVVKQLPKPVDFEDLKLIIEEKLKEIKNI